MAAVDVEPTVDATGIAARRPQARGWGWFAVWTATGAVASFGGIGLLTIGLPPLVIAGGVTAWF
jgi:hypothetical protein